MAPASRSVRFSCVRRHCARLIGSVENYLQLSPDDPVRPGALGLGQARAILIIYVWLIYIYCTPLVGGLLADCWLGRRKTILLGFM
jgi:POT family proton-dependent oligopeptide transporter